MLPLFLAPILLIWIFRMWISKTSWRVHFRVSEKSHFLLQNVFNGCIQWLWCVLTSTRAMLACADGSSYAHTPGTWTLEVKRPRPFQRCTRCFFAFSILASTSFYTSKTMKTARVNLNRRIRWYKYVRWCPCVCHGDRARGHRGDEQRCISVGHG